MSNPGTAFTKKIYLAAGGYDPAFSLSEDYDLYLRMLLKGGRFGYTDEILVNYRRSPESVSLSNFSQMHDYIMKTRIKNNILPINIEDVKKYALPKIADSILSENGRKLWSDDRFEEPEDDK